MPRGVFPVTGTEVTLGDLLGLVSLSPAVSCQPARVVVRPQLVELDGLFSEAGRVRRRWATALAAALGRLRLPLRSRVRAGRVASARALADERTPGHADGQGARGHGVRRSRRDPRLRPARCGRDATGLELRRRRTRGRVDPAGARDPRPPGDLRLDGSRAGASSRFARRRTISAAPSPRSLPPSPMRSTVSRDSSAATTRPSRGAGSSSSSPRPANPPRSPRSWRSRGAASSPWSGSTQRASQRGRRAQSRESCGWPRTGSRPPSCVVATTSPTSSPRRGLGAVRRA